MLPILRRSKIFLNMRLQWQRVHTHYPKYLNDRATKTVQCRAVGIYQASTALLPTLGQPNPAHNSAPRHCRERLYIAFHLRTTIHEDHDPSPPA